MKKLFFLLMIGSVAYAQQQGASGVRYNAPTQFYQKTAYIAATINDTSGFISLGSASDISIFASHNDSATVVVFYRLRSKNVGGSSGYTVTTSWTLLDTIGVDGAGALSNTSGGAQLVGNIALSTILGYDEIQFYRDYITGTAVADNDGGATNTLRMFYYFKKPDAVIAK